RIIGGRNCRQDLGELWKGGWEMTETDCIDSVIILGILLEENITEFQDYVRTIGYKSRNKGLLTITIVGEIFTNLY
ncbi:MAG: hypothetical protein AAB968_04530, partial [Patescibacteria group bacterium]